MRMKARSNITTRAPEAERGPGGNSESAPANLRPSLEKPLRRRRHGGPRRNHCAGADTAAHGSLRPGLEKLLRRRRHGARPPARGPAAAL